MELAIKNYKMWLNKIKEHEILEDLVSIKGDFQEIEDRFGSDIKFGTAGLRGVMQSGSNRMNIYTVRKATQGLANYLNSKNKNFETKELIIVISYDSRINSKLFAWESASVMAANNIKVYLTSELAPTPFLSYCIRKLGAQAGIMITASHNTAEYNGYKCYGGDGAQIDEIISNEIYGYISRVDIFNDINRIEYERGIESGRIKFIGESLTDAYLNEILSQRILKTTSENLNITYTPLNGAGNKYVRKALKLSGFEQVSVVKAQEEPDGNFTTCPYPNPEKIEAFYEAIKVAKLNESDIILATDPDSDRLGVCVKQEDDYRLLSGNEIGALLTDYILKCRSDKKLLPKRGVICKTIVSTMMVDKISENYGCEVKNVLIGFKNIAREIMELEKNGREEDYVFGFEESNGYLCGSYVRDKDAVSAAILVCEMAAYYKSALGLNLAQVLEKMYSKYGYFGEKTLSYEFRGPSSNSKIQKIMEFFREAKVLSIGNNKVGNTLDYLNFDGNSKSNIIELRLENDAKLIIRPSGTEPKIKFYVLVKANSKAEKDRLIQEFCEFVESCMRNLI
ncbi:MAG: phospho-sugar mutase [Acutalibacteraceae bacterium]